MQPEIFCRNISIYKSLAHRRLADAPLTKLQPENPILNSQKGTPA
ncbi:hypothetical protein QEO93_09150 [Kingella negevensis]|nr:hypothetical protein [Kingella negevensis]WII90588.1 hypothetical protein QEO93_09150 [Kingella negevensis]